VPFTPSGAIALMQDMLYPSALFGFNASPALPTGIARVSRPNTGLLRRVFHDAAYIFSAVAFLPDAIFHDVFVTI
jgi:hypothetical protein